MLTPKRRPRDFRVPARPNSPKKCLCGLKPNLRGRNQAGIREEFGGLARAGKYCYINDLGWLCWEAAANESPFLKFPDRRENTGNSLETPLAACTNQLKHETFWTNSLQSEQGIFHCKQGKTSRLTAN
jgi:hypothetical protein